MRILCTHPGRSGDLLWALPTVRALHETTGAAVDVATSEKYAGLCSLIEQQPYVAHAAPIQGWEVQETAPITPRVPTGYDPYSYDQVVHLGYVGWPTAPLPYDVANRAGVPIDLDRPWIIQPSSLLSSRLAVGFTDEHFELKWGLTTLVASLVGAGSVAALCARGSRWDTETPSFGDNASLVYALEWLGAARRIASAEVFFGDCSALHVLACAMGVPCVVMEPAEARWHPIFWPYGQDGPQVTLVRGLDGKPTFDARHCREALVTALDRRRDHAQ